MQITQSETVATPSGVTAPTAIEICGLRRHFGAGDRRVQAVDGIDLTVGVGEVIALLGPNGAGKTTTLDMLLGLTAPDEGSVRVLGASASAAARQGRIAGVLQSGGLLADLTVGETVRLIASLHGNAAQARVDEVMRRADLAHLSRRRVAKCSGGEQQRVRFALALVAEPDILVLDEPTAGMDVTARHRFWDAMHDEAANGRTILFATHYLQEAEQFAQRTVVMHHGRIVADAATHDLRAGLGARTVSATVPAVDADTMMAALRQHPGVVDLRLDAGRVHLRSTDSDAVARVLLDAGAHDLEIAVPTLETAFTTLTED